MKNFDLWMSISGSLLIAAPIQAQKKAKEKQPNVIFIIADDLGYGDMSCYGAHRVQTPHVDTLASSGIRFTDAHAVASTSTPSRYSLFTGHYAWRRKNERFENPLVLSIPFIKNTIHSYFHVRCYP